MTEGASANFDNNYTVRIGKHASKRFVSQFIPNDQVAIISKGKASVWVRDLLFRENCSIACDYELEVLSMALAANRQFTEALQAAEKALALAQAAGNKALAESLRQSITIFRAKKDQNS